LKVEIEKVLETSGALLDTDRTPSLNFQRHRDSLQLWRALPTSLPLEILSQIDTAFASVSSTKDSSLKQLKRDIERDKLLVNGSRLVGADGGLEVVLRQLMTCCNEVLDTCGFASLDETTAKEFAEVVLRKASRTNSGGVAYQVLQAAIEPHSTILVPVSTMALPLRIKVSVGRLSNGNEASTMLSAPASRQASWGLKCAVECTTFYQLRSIAGASESCATGAGDSGTSNLPIDENFNPVVRVVYHDTIGMEIDGGSKQAIVSPEKWVGTSATSGYVVIHQYSETA
jgi:hypothetical protein